LGEVFETLIELGGWRTSFSFWLSRPDEEPQTRAGIAARFTVQRSKANSAAIFQPRNLRRRLGKRARAPHPGKSMSWHSKPSIHPPIHPSTHQYDMQELELIIVLSSSSRKPSGVDFPPRPDLTRLDSKDAVARNEGNLSFLSRRRANC